MSVVFADTFYFIALLSPDDEAHPRAFDYSKRMDRLVTTEWVLLELADGLADTANRSLFKTTRDSILAEPAATVVPFDMSLHQRAINLYARRLDKEWSLTDCVSFLVMEEHGLREALTGDHHFEQAGFTALLK